MLLFGAQSQVPGIHDVGGRTVEVEPQQAAHLVDISGGGVDGDRFRAIHIVLRGRDKRIQLGPLAAGLRHELTRILHKICDHLGLKMG